MTLWNRLTRPLIKQWHRLHAWRATRLYASVAARSLKLEADLHKADRLTAKHVRPPMPLFDRKNKD